MNCLTRTYRIAARLSLCTLAGCGRPESPNVQPVAGRLIVAGMPAANANIYFYPCDPSQQRIPVGITTPDGTFRLTTIHPSDSTPKGGLRCVTVIWPDYSLPHDECTDIIHDRLGLQYADRNTSELHAVVRPGKNEVVLRVNMPSGSRSISATKGRTALTPRAAMGSRRIHPRGHQWAGSPQHSHTNSPCASRTLTRAECQAITSTVS